MRSFVAFLFLASVAPTADAPGFSSLAEFWSATPSKVDQRLNAHPLDLSRPLDRKVRHLMDELDNLSQVTTTVYWADGFGSNAHPQKGVGLDGKQLAKLVDTQSDSAVEEAIRFILGHEQAHIYQFKYYSSGLDDPGRRRMLVSASPRYSRSLRQAITCARVTVRKSADPFSPAKAKNSLTAL